MKKEIKDDDISAITLKIKVGDKKYLKDLLKNNLTYCHLSLSSFVRMAVNSKLEEIRSQEESQNNK